VALRHLGEQADEDVGIERLHEVRVEAGLQGALAVLGTARVT